MLNRIVIINSELYAKASIHIGENSSIQITAENNVGKSSFLNALNFLYITDKDQMRFEDGRRLADSMKHYFDGTSLHSFIIFEIFKNGYYCILVKATPENNIEYYKINGEYREELYIQKSNEGFKAKKWESVLQELTTANSTDPPKLLKSEDLFNLVYNTDKNKSPVVWIKKEVKRKGRSLSNSFTEVYKHLIKTSDINERSFRSALLIADNKQDVSLNVFTSSSYDKINEFERKRLHLVNLKAVRADFDQLKLVNDRFIAEELALGKMKNTFIKGFSSVERELTEKVKPDSSLSISIRNMERRIDLTLKSERDHLITERANTNGKMEVARTTIGDLTTKLNQVADYEPRPDNLMFQALVDKHEEAERNRKLLEAQITQLERTKFTKHEIDNAIKELTLSIASLETSIAEFNNLLYQNIAADPEIIRKVYTYLSAEVTKLNKDKIIKSITNVNTILNVFDGEIEVGDIDIKNLPTVKQLRDELETKKKELNEKSIQLEAIKNRSTLQASIDTFRDTIRSISDLIEKVKLKPQWQQLRQEHEILLNVTLKKLLVDIQAKIESKDLEIEKERSALDHLKKEKREHEASLQKYRTQYQNIHERTDVYEIEEVLDTPFDKLYEKFSKTYETFRQTREGRKELKDLINSKLKKDIQDIKHFIREVEEEINNIPYVDKVINNLLDTLSYEIGSPTYTFLSQFNDFKTFVSKSYNAKLAEYPVSNIRDVKVRIYESDELVSDLKKISNLKIANGLDFDNTYTDSKRALERQLTLSKGKPVDITDLFTIKVEITKATGNAEEIDLSKQVQSRGTNIVLKLYLFLNILKDLLHADASNKIVIYVDELDAIGQTNVKHLIRFCKDHYFIPIFAAPRKVEGIQKYYMIKEPQATRKNQKAKISFGELQSFPVEYRNAEQNV
jgi:hypothetical protein